MSLSAQQLDAIGRPIIIASHQRSGTHLTIDLLRRHFPDTNPKLKLFESLHHLYIDIDSFREKHHNPMSVDDALRLLARNPRPIIKTHALPNASLAKKEFRPIVEAIFDRAQTLCVVRDGRSVMPSLQLFEREWNPKADIPLSDYMRTQYEGLSRPAYWNHHVRAWQAVKDCLTVRFDRVVKDTVSTLGEIGGFLGMTPTMREPLLPPATKTILEGRLRRLVGNTNSTTIPGRPKGVKKPKKWHEAFTKQDREFFDEAAGQLLIDLGYEPNRDWIDAAPSGAQP